MLPVAGCHHGLISLSILPLPFRKLYSYSPQSPDFPLNDGNGYDFPHHIVLLSAHEASHPGCHLPGITASSDMSASQQNLSSHTNMLLVSCKVAHKY